MYYYQFLKINVLRKGRSEACRQKVYLQFSQVEGNVKDALATYRG